MAVDPVCGMEVDAGEETSITYLGGTYHFCTEECRQRFVREPWKYVRVREDFFLKRASRLR